MIPYANITKAVLLRANQIGDAASASALETKFAGALTTAVEGMELPLSALKLAVLASEKRIAEAIAFSSIETYRTALYGVSDDLLSGEAIPTRGGSNKEFIGAFGNVRDTITDEMLTEKPVQEIRRMNRLYASGIVKIRPYHFHKAGGFLEHTRDLAYVEGCIWDYEAQALEYAAQSGITAGFSPLPQGVESWWIADILANLPQENFFINEAGYYAQIAQACEANLKRGVVSAPTLIDTTANSEPVKN